MTFEPAMDAAPTLDPMLGLCVDSYRVRQKIGEGGMGAVYEVEHERLGRRAAAKFLLPRYAQDPTVARRFTSEAQLLSRIQHPGLVSVFAIGELPDRTQYFLMDYLRGETLGARLRSRRLPELGAALRLVQQVASTLAVVHAHGVIHRDLKPDNIMLVPDPHVQDGERQLVPEAWRAQIGAALAASDFAQAVRLADAATGRSEQEGAWRLIGWRACRQGLEPLARTALPHLEEDGRILVRSECRKQSIALPP